MDKDLDLTHDEIIDILYPIGSFYIGSSSPREDFVLQPELSKLYVGANVYLRENNKPNEIHCKLNKKRALYGN